MANDKELKARYELLLLKLEIAELKLEIANLKIQLKPTFYTYPSTMPLATSGTNITSALNGNVTLTGGSN